MGLFCTDRKKTPVVIDAKFLQHVIETQNAPFLDVISLRLLLCKAVVN